MSLLHVTGMEKMSLRLTFLTLLAYRLKMKITPPITWTQGGTPCVHVDCSLLRVSSTKNRYLSIARMLITAPISHIFRVTWCQMKCLLFVWKVWIHGVRVAGSSICSEIGLLWQVWRNTQPMPCLYLTEGASIRKPTLSILYYPTPSDLITSGILNVKI